MITEGTGSAAEQLTFKIDGVVKAPSGPVTGETLYMLAGNPAQLTLNGKVIPRDGNTVTIEKGAEYITKHNMESESELNPEHTLQGKRSKVAEPEHGAAVKTKVTGVEDHSKPSMGETAKDHSGKTGITDNGARAGATSAKSASAAGRK